MARDLRNAGASVRARLLEHARTKGADFQILLTRYAIERLLYRLSVSDQRDRFVLKGAMLFSTWVVDPFRPTRDLDRNGVQRPRVQLALLDAVGVDDVHVPDCGRQHVACGCTRFERMAQRGPMLDLLRERTMHQRRV